MPFDSLNFWILFLPFLFIYWLTPSRFKNVFTLSFSLFLYGWWDWRFLIPIFISTGTDFLIGLKLENTEYALKRKLYLFTSIFINLGLLALFKYFRSYLEPGLFSGILLPIGISFYTFQSLSYTIDIYLKKLKPSSNPINFFLYVAFFPQLVAGPIEKAKRLLPQIIASKKFSSSLFEQGFYLCLLGLVKKVFFAPFFADHAEYIWNYGQGNIPLLILASVLTTIQVYFDFSAYSDLARGLANTLGYKIIINFKPFIFSKNPTEFWRCWHISLTLWIREYLVIGTRRSTWPTVLKRTHLLIALCLVGLWHDWTLSWFLFGLFHGFMLIGYLSFRPNISKLSHKVGRLPVNFFAYIFMIFVYAVSGFLHAYYFFPETLNRQLQSLYISWIETSNVFLPMLANILPALIPWILFESLQHFKQDYDFIMKTHWTSKAIYASLCLAAIILLDRSTNSGFIYFDF